MPEVDVLEELARQPSVDRQIAFQLGVSSV